MFRYSGAGDELISPVYIAPTLPPYVERTWPEDEVAVLMRISMMVLMLEMIMSMMPYVERIWPEDEVEM